MHPPLDKIIYNALLADRRPPTGLLHCSSHSWQPLRFTQLSQAIHTDESDYGSLMTMKIGTLTHDWLEGIVASDSKIDILGPDWSIVGTEIDLTADLPEGWTGTCDYLFQHIYTGKYVVGDLKTIKAEGVTWLGSRPKPEHVTQVSCYHAALSKRYDLHPDLFVCYAPKSKTAKQETVLPVIKTAPAEPSAWANMVGIKRQVDEYLAEVVRTGELDNDKLAPMPDMIPKIGWSKNQNVWDVTLREGWETEYIGSAYPEYLVPRRPSQKVGHYLPDGYYIPRKGIEQPDNIPTLSQAQMDRGR